MTTTDVDVLVAGAGAAGTAAAIAAAERGRSVLIAEASEHFRRGCNTAMSTSMVPAGGSRWQERLGIDDSPERFLDDIMRKTRGAADPVVAAALTRVAPTLAAWLADTVGVPLELVTDFRYPGHTADRCHTVPDRAGVTLHRHLLDEVERRPDATLVVPLRLRELAVGDAVVATLERPDGRTEEVAADRVVLATNGFGADPDLVRRHLPSIADGLYHGGDGSTGDALRLGRVLGADTGYLDAYQGHGSVATPHGVLLTWAFVMHGGILVNAEGERFGDETVGYSEFGPAVVAQPGGTAWAVYDARIHDLLVAFKDYQDLIAADAIRWADGLDEVAAITGAPAERLGATMAAAAAAAQGTATDPHGRTSWEQPLAPPLAVVKVTGALFHTQGGLRVDEHARVLRGGEPIPGLYAAGGAAVGISGHGPDGYLAGNGLLAALGLGYLAGSHEASP